MIVLCFRFQLELAAVDHAATQHSLYTMQPLEEDQQ
jgi:hypothetical protein